MATKINYGSVEFSEAIDFLNGKLNIPTERWDDLWQEQHDLGFMVAGAMQADLIQDLRDAVTKAREGTLPFDAFRREFENIVAARGWTGWTGETTKKGRAWRAKVIYETNLRQSYNAGRERQLADPELRKRRPYGLYKHGDAIVPRESHLAWDGMVVPLDDPWWDTHTPMNGWGCSCKKFALSEADVKRRGLKITKGADMPYQGEGIDPGFAYRPGSDAVRRMYTQLHKKAGRYPAGLRGWFNKFLDKITGKKFDAPLPPPMVSRMIHKRGTSPEFIELVKQAVSALPLPVQDMLDKAGYQVVTGTDIEYILPHLKGKRPPGWPPGTDWRYCDGTTSVTPAWLIIAIPEKSVVWPSNIWQDTKTGRLRGVILHEVGHGIDFINNIAKRNDIADLFAKELTGLEYTGLSEAQKAELDSIANQGIYGLHQVLADFFANRHGNRTAVNIMSKTFPATYEKYTEILDAML